MSKKPAVPDAWDDDYETKADQQKAPPATVVPTRILSSRAERKAQHAEANRRLWESAENPQTFHFIEARNNIPLIKSDIKPQVQLLSRKPKSVTVVGQNGIDISQEEDSEEERRKKQELNLIEKQEKARREREDKQKRYAEVRERLFGSSTPAPESLSGRPSSPSTNGGRLARGSRRGNGDLSGRASRSGSSTDQSPARGPPQSRELYQPDVFVKPKSVLLTARDNHPTLAAVQPVRHPRGPDGSGRGGNGFAPRGNRSSAT